MCTCILPGRAVPEMTYTVSGGTLNPTHSLAHSLGPQASRAISLKVFNRVDWWLW